jgi:hypothetical protein
VFAMARNRKFTNGKYVSDLMRHLPKSCYSRRAIHKPDGRRCDYWVFQKRATLNHLGDVTIVLSKKRGVSHFLHTLYLIDSRTFFYKFCNV